MRLLHIDSSILDDASVSRRLSAAIVAEWRRRIPGLQVVRRDLADAPLPHLDGAVLAAGQSDGIADSAIGAEIARNAEVLEEFLAADIVVIGAPMYNLSIPSQLKAWLDRIIVAGKTFRYTETGPEGLAGGKKVVMASSRGGLYAPGSPQAPHDFQEPYLRAILGLIGVTDFEVVRAEGVALGPEPREQSINAALALIPQTSEGLSEAA